MNPQLNTPVNSRDGYARLPQGAAGEAAPGSGAGHRAAVPLSVYRDLAAELNATKTELEYIRLENQKLVEQNYRLRQDASQVVESAQALQKLAQRLALSPPGGSVAPLSAGVAGTGAAAGAGVTIAPPGIDRPYPDPMYPDRPHSDRPASPMAGSMAGEFQGPDVIPESYPGSHPPQAIPHPARSTSRAAAALNPLAEEEADFQGDLPHWDLGGWWLMLTVLAIVIMAFGAGFLIMRPFLPDPTPQPTAPLDQPYGEPSP